MTAVVLQEMTKADLKVVAAIEQLCFPEPWSERLLADELRLANRRYLVARHDEIIVGYVGWMFVDDEVHVNTIASIPEARGQGIATRLLLEGIEVAVARGATGMTLEVAASNEVAQRLYQRFGLAPVGVRKGYYAGGEDALVMWNREIASPEEIARRSELARGLS